MRISFSRQTETGAVLFGEETAGEDFEKIRQACPFSIPRRDPATGQMFIASYATGPMDYTLPTAAVGLSVCFFDDRFDELLTACDVLVSGSSTTVLEAILLGKDVDDLILPATLEELKLSTRVINALRNNDVLAPQQLINLTTAGEDDLLALTGIGPKAMEEITDTLKAFSLWPQPTEAKAVMEAPAEEPEIVSEAKAIVETAAEQPSKDIEIAEAAVAETLPAPAEAEKETAIEEAAPTVIDIVKSPTVIPTAGDWGKEEEHLSDSAKRAKKKKKKQQLIYDEKLGEVVKRRTRKPGRQREEWEDYD